MKKIIILTLFCLSLFGENIFEKSIERTQENRVYEVISKINHIHEFINQYILTYAEAPSQNNLISEYDQISSVNWPKDINNYSTEVTFSIDFDENIVRYSNIFRIYPSVESQYIANHNFALRLDSYFKVDLTTFDLIIPLDLNVILFMNKVEVITNALGLGAAVINNTKDNTVNCNSFSDRMWYQPDGRGDFMLWECRRVKVYGNGATLYNWTPVLQNYQNIIDIDETLQLPYKNMKGYSLKSSQYVKEVVFTEHNGTKSIE